MHGKNFIGSELSAKGTTKFHGVNPLTDEQLPGDFYEATQEEINAACEKANAAFDAYRKLSGAKRAEFLEQIATNLENNTELVARTVAESGLPEGRITGERGRTCGQLRMFANLIKDGSYVDARLDLAQPDRQPLPKADIRRMNIAIGAVGVFGASNFPLAFSTAGGDTASALAAGCPVVVKAHPFHPGAAEIVADEIIAAAKATGMPEGVFSMVNGGSIEVGQAVVMNPNIKAIGFTGSIPAGTAIFRAAANRPEPIPVYAEMGSSNPVFIMPERSQAEDLAAGVVGSVCIGAGQFCTNPGALVLLKGAETDALLESLASLIKETPAGTTVHKGIKQAYDKHLASKIAVAGVEVLAQSEVAGAHPSTDAYPSLLKTTAKNYFANKEVLGAEVFGPTTFVVVCDDVEEMTAYAEALEGHLTASLQATEDDLATYGSIFNILERKAGRLIINQYPTGVEVCDSMQHGGPFPASSDTRTTSVGTASIERYIRPVAYQNFPASLLPEELKDGNPLGIMRKVDGEYTRD